MRSGRGSRAKIRGAGLKPGATLRNNEQESGLAGGLGTRRRFSRRLPGGDDGVGVDADGVFDAASIAAGECGDDGNVAASARIGIPFVAGFEAGSWSGAGRRAGLRRRDRRRRRRKEYRVKFIEGLFDRGEEGLRDIRRRRRRRQGQDRDSMAACERDNYFPDGWKA